MADPEAGAVLLVFEQRGVREAGVAEGVGHGEIHAVLLYHLREQVAGVFGAACLADDGDGPVAQGDDRLDGEDASGQGGCAGYASAAFEVFERVEKGDEVDSALDLFYKPGDLVHTPALVGETVGVQRENLRAQRGALSVDYPDTARIICGGYHRALVGARERGREGQGHNVVPLRGQTLKLLLKFGRSGLAGGRKRVALNKAFVELTRGHRQPVDKFLVAEVHAQAHTGHIQLGELLHREVKGRVDKYFNSHTVLHVSNVECSTTIRQKS